MLWAQTLPYQNPALTAEERADDLLGRLTLEEKTKLMMNGSPAIERLGVPRFEWWNEALHGVGRNGTATVFPQAIGLAAMFDAELLEQALRLYQGRALYEGNLSENALKPLSKKYGLIY